MVSILGANSVSGGYEVSNSLRFNNDDSPYLTFTPSSAGDRDVWTWSAWIKTSGVGTLPLFTAGAGAGGGWSSGGTGTGLVLINGTFYTYWNSPSSPTTTSAVFRDPAAWYHVVLQANDTTLKVYVNSVEHSSKSISGDGEINNTNAQTIGAYSNNTDAYFDGYMTEINFVDGTAKAPTDFGEFDNNGVWIPKKYTGTYGTNGFFLEFQQTGTSQNSSGIGADTSGNDNHFAVTNLAATDITEDTCTNNFATMNALWRNASAHANTYSEGNLKINLNSSGGNTYSTIAVSQGKWYFEFETLSNFQCQFEGRTTDNFADYSAGSGNTTFTWYYSGNIKVNNSDSGVSQAYGHQSNNTNETKEICGVAVDLDNNKVYFHRQGTYVNSGNPSTGSNGITITNAEYMFGFSNDSGTTRNVANFNFGNPAFSISSGNNDGKYGNFEYAVPSGYYALCTKRLAEFG